MNGKNANGFVAAGLAGLLALAGGSLLTTAHAQDGPSFGKADDIAYAEQLWAELKQAHLVGPGAITSKPYEGTEPHGAILVTLQSELTIDGHTGAVLVKNNYMGDGVSVESVAEHPDRNLAAVTVMFRRAAGYDSADKDWFWAKYRADGSLDANPKGVKLAGRVGKNPEGACIACHRGAPGGDFVFFNNRLAR